MPVDLDGVEAVDVPECCVEPKQLEFVDGGHLGCKLMRVIREARDAQRDGKWALVDAILSEALGDYDPKPEPELITYRCEAGHEIERERGGRYWCSTCYAQGEGPRSAPPMRPVERLESEPTDG